MQRVPSAGKLVVGAMAREKIATGAQGAGKCNRYQARENTRKLYHVWLLLLFMIDGRKTMFALIG